MAKDGFAVRNADADEMEFLVSMARREGWNPGPDDGAAFHAADPQGFFVGEMDGSPVSCMSAVSYGPRA